MDITAASAVIMFSQPLLFPTPIQIQQFSADDVYETDDVTVGETQMGVDNHLTGGFVNNPTPQRISLMADSISVSFFDKIYQRQKADQTTYPINGTTTLTAVGTKFTMRRGFLITWSPMPSAGKLLKTRRAMIHWERVTPNPV